MGTAALQAVKTEENWVEEGIVFLISECVAITISKLNSKNECLLLIYLSENSEFPSFVRT